MIMEKYEYNGEIDEKYLIKERLKEGGTSNVYLVIDKKTNEEYVAKTIKDDKKYKNCFQKEIEILEELKEYKNPYIINIINSGKGDIIFKNESEITKEEKKEYIIFEYALYDDLYDFIIFFKDNQGTELGELYAKIILQKILGGVKFCHEHNICHRDLKLKNILLDKDFTPKICDFGFACKNRPDLTDMLGTGAYVPPEIGVDKKSYDGFKVDIFCLGEILISLTTGKPGFNMPVPNDEFFSNIAANLSKVYWKKFCKQIPGLTLSEEFKDLYVKMLKYKPSQRPTIQEVLQHPWFKEINEMDKEQLENIEKKLKEKFLEVADEIKNKTQKIEEVKKTNYDTPTAYRSGDDDNIFPSYIKPKVLLIPINMKYSIKIIGSLNPTKFMNSLYNLLNKEFENDDVIIKPHKQKLKLDLILNEEEEENEEITKEIIEELKKLGIEEKNNDDENYNELIIRIKLYKISDGYLLKFIQKKGLREKFYAKFVAISDLVKKLIS